MAGKLVIALGGNALRKKGDPFDLGFQFKNVQKSMEVLAGLVENGYKIAITHGNGPQVGVDFHRNILTRELYPPYSLDALNAETQGWIGYFIVQALQNILGKRSISRKAVAILTRVEVSEDDPDFKDPSKPIGDFYDKEEALKLAKKFGVTVKEEKGRGWRIVVPSPWPRKVLEAEIIRELVDSGIITVSVGGGGIPVIRADGGYKGVSAVIDKDRASAVLALEIEADILAILTETDYVYLNFNTPKQRPLYKVKLKEIKAYYEEGHFPRGSMGPKIESAIHFLENGGKEVIITSIENAKEAIEGSGGTHILPD